MSASVSVMFFPKPMKTAILSFLTCLFFTTGFAQKVSLKDEVVYKDGMPYCRLVKQGSNMAPRISVSSLDSPEIELIVAQFNDSKGLYVISFMESGAVAYRKSTIGIAKMFAEDLVYNRVVLNGKVSPQGEQLLLRQYEGTQPRSAVLSGIDKAVSGLEEAFDDILANPPARRKNAEQADSEPETVERSRTGMLLIFGEDIKQDNKKIGSYKTAQKAAEGSLIKVVSFYGYNGEKVAEAVLKGVNSKSARLVILKNNQVVNLPLEDFSDIGQVKEMAQYLVDRYFL